MCDSAMPLIERNQVMIKYIRIFAQVIVAIIGTICFAVILAAFSPETAIEFLNGMISGLPWCDPWVDLLSKFHYFNPAELTDLYIKSFFQATIMGICMTVCKKNCRFRTRRIKNTHANNLKRRTFV